MMHGWNNLYSIYTTVFVTRRGHWQCDLRVVYGNDYNKRNTLYVSAYSTGAVSCWPIYLWHMLIIELVRVFVNDQFYYHGIADFTQWLLLSALVVSISITLAGLSFHYIEQPILNWAKKKCSGTKPWFAIIQLLQLLNNCFYFLNNYVYFLNNYFNYKPKLTKHNEQF